jgi:hypothetical protein
MAKWTVLELQSELESYEEDDREIAIQLPGGTKTFGFVFDDSEDLIKMIVTVEE